MNHYLIFGFGVFIGFFLGFLMAGILDDSRANFKDELCPGCSPNAPLHGGSIP